MNKLKFYIKNVWLLCTALALFVACNKNDDNNPETPIDDAYKPVKVTPTDGLRLTWDYSSLSKAVNLGSTPKAIRASDGTLFLVYQNDNNVYMVQSKDNGVSWSGNTTLFPRSSHIGKNGDVDLTFTEFMGQPTVYQLRNGDLVAACAVKYQYTLTNTSPATVVEFPAAIKVRRITNNGTTLEEIREVYANLGCQNPSFLQLPNGQLQLYFANGTKLQTINTLNSTIMSTAIPEQAIVLISSDDEGRTWSSYIKDFGPDGVDRSWIGTKDVASRTGGSNNYPVPVVLGENIVVALADNKKMTFKPFTVRTPLSANWDIPVKGDTPDRDYALYEILPDKYLMTGTSLYVLPSGETMLAYESDEARNTGFEVMEVAIGNDDARNFKFRTRPFRLPEKEKAINNSIVLLDNNTAMAFTASNHASINANTLSPWSIKGYFLNNLVINDSQIDDYPVFVGGTTEAQLRAGLGIDGSNLYVKVIAKDNTPVEATNDTQQGDGVYLYIDAANLSLLDVDAGISKFWISSVGDVTRWDGKEGKWVNANNNGVSVNKQTTSDGYTFDITIPRSTLTNFNNQGIRFGIGLSNYVNENSGVIELLSLCQDSRSSTWLGITF
jgi:hypothetical protein